MYHGKTIILYEIPIGFNHFRGDSIQTQRFIEVKTKTHLDDFLEDGVVKVMFSYDSYLGIY